MFFKQSFTGNWFLIDYWFLNGYLLVQWL